MNFEAVTKLLQSYTQINVNIKVAFAQQPVSDIHSSVIHGKNMIWRAKQFNVRLTVWVKH